MAHSFRTTAEINRWYLSLLGMGVLAICLVAASGLIAYLLPTAVSIIAGVVMAIAVIAMGGKRFGWPMAWALVVAAIAFAFVALKCSELRQTGVADKTGPVSLQKVDELEDQESFYLQDVELWLIDREFTTCDEEDCWDHRVVSMRPLGSSPSTPIRHWVEASQDSDFDETFIFSRIDPYGDTKDEVKKACALSPTPCAEEAQFFSPLAPPRKTVASPFTIPLFMFFLLWPIPVLVGWQSTRKVWIRGQREGSAPPVETMGQLTKRYAVTGLMGTLCFLVLPAAGLLASFTPEWVAASIAIVLATFLITLSIRFASWGVLWAWVLAIGCMFASIDSSTKKRIIEAALKNDPISLQDLRKKPADGAYRLVGLKQGPYEGEYEECYGESCSMVKLFSLVSAKDKQNTPVSVFMKAETKPPQPGWPFMQIDPTVNQRVGIDAMCREDGPGCAKNWVFVKGLDPEFYGDEMTSTLLSTTGWLLLFGWLVPLLIAFVIAIARKPKVT